MHDAVLQHWPRSPQEQGEQRTCHALPSHVPARLWRYLSQAAQAAFIWLAPSLCLVGCMVISELQGDMQCPHSMAVYLELSAACNTHASTPGLRSGSPQSLQLQSRAACASHSPHYRSPCQRLRSQVSSAWPHARTYGPPQPLFCACMLLYGHFACCITALACRLQETYCNHAITEQCCMHARGLWLYSTQT